MRISGVEVERIALPEPHERLLERRCIVHRKSVAAGILRDRCRACRVVPGLRLAPGRAAPTSSAENHRTAAAWPSAPRPAGPRARIPAASTAALLTIEHIRRLQKAQHGVRTRQ